MSATYKGEIKWLELRTPTSEDPQETTLCITFPDDPNGLQIELLGYGKAAAKMTVRELNPDLDAALMNLEDVFRKISEAVVWASPRTIAHLVYETIYGQ